MKLVELLALELDEWPEQDSFFCDPDGEIKGTQNVFCDFYPKGSVRDKDRGKDFCDDSVCTVNQAQWQAERDRQKGGEWKRHRGGVSKLNPGQVVEVKLRCGDIQQGISGEFIWMHDACDVAANIMQYRVISQPQAEKVVVNNVYAVDNTDHGPTEVQWTEAKTDQVDGPIKWRDTVNELDAYIEEFTRERDELINRLALEGFALIEKINLNLDKIDATLDMSDWRNWKAGDIVECTHSGCDKVYTEGKSYCVDHVTNEYAKVADDCGENSFCHINNDEDVKFRLVR